MSASLPRPSRLAILLFLAGHAVASPAMADDRVRPCRHHCRAGPHYPYPYGLDVTPPVFPMPPPPEGMPPVFDPDAAPPFVPGRSPSPGPAPFPQGFVLDVPIAPDRRDDTDETAKPTLTRYREVADALARCWNPPATFDGKPWRQTTLRVSFRRDGTINGAPRIPYADQGLTAKARSDLTASLEAALRRCVPLPFSPSLGAAVAGQIFALRFIEQDQDR